MSRKQDHDLRRGQKYTEVVEALDPRRLGERRVLLDDRGRNGIVDAGLASPVSETFAAHPGSSARCTTSSRLRQSIANILSFPVLAVEYRPMGHAFGPTTGSTSGWSCRRRSRRRAFSRVAALERPILQGVLKQLQWRQHLDGGTHGLWLGGARSIHLTRRTACFRPVPTPHKDGCARGY